MGGSNCEDRCPREKPVYIAPCHSSWNTYCIPAAEEKQCRCHGQHRRGQGADTWDKIPGVKFDYSLLLAFSEDSSQPIRHFSAILTVPPCTVQVSSRAARPCWTRCVPVPPQRDVAAPRGAELLLQTRALTAVWPRPASRSRLQLGRGSAPR